MLLAHARRNLAFSAVLFLRYSSRSVCDSERSSRFRESTELAYRDAWRSDTNFFSRLERSSRSNPRGFAASLMRSMPPSAAATAWSRSRSQMGSSPAWTIKSFKTVLMLCSSSALSFWKPCRSDVKGYEVRRKQLFKTAHTDIDLDDCTMNGVQNRAMLARRQRSTHNSVCELSGLSSCDI